MASARKALSAEKGISEEAQRQAELLNQQVAALRTQLGELQDLLDDAKVRDVAKDVELQSLGSELKHSAGPGCGRRNAAARNWRRPNVHGLRQRPRTWSNTVQSFFGRLRDVLGSQEGVRIEGDRFVFSSEVLFPPGGAVLSIEGQDEITKVCRHTAQRLSGIFRRKLTGLFGWTGIRTMYRCPVLGEFADNWELSQARALSVVKYMISSLGIDPTRLSANGFGEYQPVALGDAEEARAQNRRIELKFTEK